jgi:hypothetical protein
MVTDVSCAHARPICGDLLCRERHLMACTEALDLPGGCPADFGPWGAWRSCAREVTWLACMAVIAFGHGYESWWLQFTWDAMDLLRAIDADYQPFDDDHMNAKYPDPWGGGA